MSKERSLSEILEYVRAVAADNSEKERREKAYSAAFDTLEAAKAEKEKALEAENEKGLTAAVARCMIAQKRYDRAYHELNETPLPVKFTAKQNNAILEETETMFRDQVTAVYAELLEAVKALHPLAQSIMNICSERLEIVETMHGALPTDYRKKGYGTRAYNAEMVSGAVLRWIINGGLENDISGTIRMYAEPVKVAPTAGQNQEETETE